MRNWFYRPTRPAFGLVLLAWSGMAADQVQCPARVVVRQEAVPVPGWSVHLDDSPNQLAGITFYDGKPEDRASLAPDTEKPVNGKTLSTWVFNGTDRAVWVACRYASTSVTLTREIPKTVRTCSVTYNPRESIGGLPAIQKIECK